MNSEILVSGYRRILSTIYSPKHYYARVKNVPAGVPAAERRRGDVSSSCMSGPWPSPWCGSGIIGRERYQYWKLFFWSLFRRPRLFPLAITLSIYGFHFRQVFRLHEKRLRAARVIKQVTAPFTA